ncbi:MAG: hypothetical protein U0793_00720 [Gemmataceae bacterium]
MGVGLHPLRQAGGVGEEEDSGERLGAFLADEVALHLTRGAGEADGLADDLRLLALEEFEEEGQATALVGLFAGSSAGGEGAGKQTEDQQRERKRQEAGAA